MQQEKDINTTTNKIQVQNDTAHIYDETGKHFLTIPYNILIRLWNQYNQRLHDFNDLSILVWFDSIFVISCDKKTNDMIEEWHQKTSKHYVE